MKQEKTVQEALKLLEMKFNFGNRLYRNRDELHDRRTCHDRFKHKPDYDN